MGIKVLVTGGLGFIGTNLVRFLEQKKAVSKIIIIDDFSKSEIYQPRCSSSIKYFLSSKDYKKNKYKINVIKSNIKDFSFAKKICSDIDYVVHLAAESGVDVSVKLPKKSFDINVNGTFNYLESSRVNNVKNFIFASSGSVFGSSKPPMKESFSKSPISPYGSSKLSIESFCRSYSEVYGAKTTILRFSNAYGDYSFHKNSVITKYIRNILDNKPLPIFGDGKQTRDYIHVNDIVSAIYKSMTNRNNFSTYHIGTGIETSINKIITIMRKSFKSHNINMPKIIYKDIRIGDMKNNSLYIKDTQKKLNWKAKIDLRQGIKKTINWYLSKR